MEFLDRYLEAVKKHLPWQRQDDILAELRANLESQLEEKEEALGRRMTPAEAEAWVKQLSPPIQVAAGYQPQQYLIGPAIFPTYRYVLRLACSWCLIIYAIGTVAKFFATAQPDSYILLGAFLRIPAVLLITAAWVTLIFAAIEYAVTHRYIPLHSMGPLSCLWSPSILAQVEPQADGKKPRTFMHASIEAAFGFLFLLWLLLVPQHPWLMMGPGAYYLDISPYQPAPVWMQFYWCAVALNVLQLGWNVENLWRRRWQQVQPIKKIGFKFGGLVPLVVLVSAHDHVLVLLKNAALNQADTVAKLDVINFYAYRSLLVIVAIVVIQLVGELVRVSLSEYRKRSAAMR
jgi:hypothetical protein